MRITKNEKELYSSEVLLEGQFESYANCGISVLISPAGSFRFKNVCVEVFCCPATQVFSYVEKAAFFH